MPGTAGRHKSNKGNPGFCMHKNIHARMTRTLLVQKTQRNHLYKWHQLSVVYFYHKNATFKMFLLQKECYKCGIRSPNCRVESILNLRSRHSIFPFISSGCLSPSLFSNFFLTLRMNWGNCFIIHVENINLFLLIHFILGK